jgi:hypothetical protein
MPRVYVTPGPPRGAVILAAVDFVVDHAVGLSAILLGVLVVTGIAVVVVRGLSLLRSTRRAQARVAEHMAVLNAEAARAQVGMERLTEGQEELARELERLSARLAVARVLARHTSEAVSILRAPLRYLGR